MSLFYHVFYLSFIAFTFFSFSNASAQGPTASSGIDEFNLTYAHAWAGGIDAAQFSPIDLNLDGVMDLVVFDRRGNRKLCFINKGIQGVIDYLYAPSYADLLPPLYEWAKFVDYDFDGRMDIFTYSPGYASMMVYRNVSDSDLKFQRVVYPYLTSWQGGGMVNIFVTNADYPGIADVDGDGDLDILTFWGLGSFLEMHKNLSMEKYGIPDSLDFEQSTYCWGQFAESDESNVLYLDTCLGGGLVVPSQTPRATRHTGSTLLLEDLDNNGLMDLLLGDVDYPTLFALYNDGTPEIAHIAYADTLFPQNDVTIRLFSMPVASLIDVNNDGLKDLLVGAFDPGIYTSQNRQSCWLYLNTGTPDQPVYRLETKEFLQDKMIDRGSGAYPVLFDFDGDGLLDLFVGNYGYYAYSYYDNYFLHSVFYGRVGHYKNVGTNQNPVFQLWDENFGGLAQLQLTGLVPAFADLNGDEAPDMLVGKNDGRLLYFINDGQGNLNLSSTYFSNIDVGDFSAPQLFDLDGDGKKDLVIGEKAGNINYYRNAGTSDQPEFVLVTDSLGKINVTDYSLSYDGFSVPAFFKDGQNNTGLICGSEKGDLLYYTNIDGNLDGKFLLSTQLNSLLDTTGVSFNRGLRTASAIGSLYADQSLQLIAGNFSGGLEFFNGKPEVTSSLAPISVSEKLEIAPNPASEKVTIQVPNNLKGAFNCYIMSADGRILFHTSSNDESGQISVEVSDFKPGLYMVLCHSAEITFTGKLVIMK